jgi:hypothetical protein
MGLRSNPPDKSTFAKASAGQAGGLSDWAELVGQAPPYISLPNPDKYRGEGKFYDLEPPLLEKKYLKTIYNCHLCAGTLDAGDIDGDGELTVLDIDQIIA